jgi:predicted CoA-substrate-specific enzyme activase
MKAEYAGVDVGSLFLKIVWLDDNLQIIKTCFQPHYGDSIELLKKELEDSTCNIAVTGTNPDLLKSVLQIDPVNHIQSLIEGVISEYPDARNIIDMGGNTATFIELTEKGKFKFTNCNSLCAAGTGSFLDEQMARLELTYQQIKNVPIIESPPKIAARCSVFAKTDLIQRQQQGYSKKEMWAGLCKGMVHTCLTTLLKGKQLEGLVVITGGVSLNPHIMYWLNQKYGDQIQTFEHAHLTSAIGAARYAKKNDISQKIAFNNIKPAHVLEKKQKRHPLLLEKSKVVPFEVYHSYHDQNNTEIRYIKRLNKKKLDVFMGIDIGSTSTKAVLLDESENPVLDVYRKTLGNPVHATKKVLSAIKEWSEKESIDITFIRAGTTGSGREFIGRVVGADLIVNEISAHTTGAMKVDPKIDTIFEIGGQDSKYMYTVNGFIRESNMNYVCAAGTGSFIEEQANKLGFRVEEVGERVLGVAPPFTSDRCTVFMEQDIQVLLKKGYSREEVLAATMYSVAQNYITRVVSNKYKNPKKIFFLGATAKNIGLVAAFEQLLEVEIKVSPFSHVMGAYGVALLLSKMLKEGD